MNAHAQKSLDDAIPVPGTPALSAAEPRITTQIARLISQLTTLVQIKKVESVLAMQTGKLDVANKAAALAAATRAAKDHGFELTDLLDGAKVSKMTTVKKPKLASPAKYKNPEDSTQTWTGKGRPPGWFTAAVTAGTTPDAMEI